MKKVVIIGAGGFGRDVLGVIEACNQVKEEFEPVGFIVDPQFGAPGTLINEKPILGGFDWLERHLADEFYVTCAVGAPHLRYHLIQRAEKLNCRFINLIHPAAMLTRWVTMGEGIVVMAGCILTNQIHVGNHVHLNLACMVSHDVTIHDFSTLSPGVHVSGNVTLNTGCFVGTGTSIIEKRELGEWSIVGAGSVVIENVPANSTVAGVPGKVIKERAPGWYLN